MKTGWQNWKGKQVFIISKNTTHPFSGKVIEVDETTSPITWLVILDKYGKRVQFSVDEILVIKEEEVRE